MSKIKTSELNYELDTNSIAQNRYKKPSNSKLLIADSKEIIKFKKLSKVLPDKSILLLNKSKVQNVRIKTYQIIKNENIEIFILKKLSPYVCECLLKFKGSKDIGKTFNTKIFDFKILNKTDVIFTIETSVKIDLLIKNYGSTPLPPYIKDEKSKYKDYISDFSTGGFSVAASTAGLHFDIKMIKKLKKKNIIIKYINLDIGLGTFKPIDTEYIEDFDIHHENYSMNENDYYELLNLKKEGYSVIAVGTTVLRVLETINITKKFDDITNLFIKPGFNFKIVDYLITNFHAPRSSLLSIVLTIYGSKWKKLYMYAQYKKLKFLSFGDAVLFKIK